MRRNPRPLVLHALTAGSGGGIERRVQLLAEAAPSQGWESIVCYWRGHAPKGATARYMRLPSARFPTWPLPLATTVRRSEPQIVHLHGPTAGSLGAATVRLASGVPVVYTDASEHRTRPILIRALRRLAARIPHLTVAVSEAVARSLVRDARVPRSRIRVIRTGVPEVPPIMRQPDSGRFIYVANFWPHKGHATLIRALASLPRATTASIVLVGDGPERTALVAQAESLGVADRVLFAGFRTHPWDQSEGAFAYVHSTMREGLGLAVAEAMMRGLPVIASDVGGIPELVTEEDSGLLVRPGDHRALAAAMLRLLDDRTLADRLGAGARRRATAEFSFDATVQQHFSLYRELLNTRRNARC